MIFIKRFLWVLPCLALLICLMPFTASAATTEKVYSGSIDDGCGHLLLPPAGTYTVTIYDDHNPDFKWVIEPFEFVADEYYRCEYYCEHPDFGKIMANVSAEIEYFYVDMAYFPLGDEVLMFDGTFVLEPYVAISEESSPSLLGSMFDVFTSISSWLILQLGVLSGLFWNPATGALTLIGILSLAGAAVGVALLMVFLVVRFLRFK